jgi:hypothetical protein
MGARKISYKVARNFALAFIATIFVFYGFRSYTCDHNDIVQFLTASLILLALPLVPAFMALSKNPLLTIAGTAFFLPWPLLAYYWDCIKPYAGGGASMSFVVVLLYGLPSAWLGVFLGKLAFKKLGFELDKT